MGRCKKTGRSIPPREVQTVLSRGEPKQVFLGNEGKTGQVKGAKRLGQEKKDLRK